MQDCRRKGVQCVKYEIVFIASEPADQLLSVTEAVFGVQGPARIRTWNICMVRQRPPRSPEPDAYSLTQPQDQNQDFVWRVCKVHLQLRLCLYWGEICTLHTNYWLYLVGGNHDFSLFDHCYLRTASTVCQAGQILPWACFTQGIALSFFGGKVSLGSSTVRPRTVPEGSSPVE